MGIIQRPWSPRGRFALLQAVPTRSTQNLAGGKSEVDRALCNLERWAHSPQASASGDAVICCGQLIDTPRCVHNLRVRLRCDAVAVPHPRMHKAFGASDMGCKAGEQHRFNARGPRRSRFKSDKKLEPLNQQGACSGCSWIKTGNACLLTDTSD